MAEPAWRDNAKAMTAKPPSRQNCDYSSSGAAFSVERRAISALVVLAVSPGRVEDGAYALPAPGVAAPGFGTMTRFRLVSTTTDFKRP